jgi:hypothetical protein
LWGVERGGDDACPEEQTAAVATAIAVWLFDEHAGVCLLGLLLARFGKAAEIRFHARGIMWKQFC